MSLFEKEIGYLFVRRSVAEDLKLSSLTGFETQDVPTIKSHEYSPSDGFEELVHDEPEPVAWLRMTGQHGQDDFGRQYSGLVVSELALEFFRERGLKLCRVRDYDSNYVFQLGGDLLERDNDLEESTCCG